MIAVRPAAARGHSAAHGMRTCHSFSCADYYDPAHMGFGPLRAINEISLDAGAAIPAQPRANIDLLTWVLAGSVKRSGREIALGVDELDVLAAGRGAVDELANASTRHAARVLQVWIQPDRLNAVPQQCAFRFDGGSGIRPIAGHEGGAGAAKIRADTRVSVVRLQAGQRLRQPLCLDRRAWLQATSGRLLFNDVTINAGDGAATMHETIIDLIAIDEGEWLLFDLPAF
ncbi:MAG: pirin family protein [Dokdonella sp.]